jgi:endonuclease/exonuclease/phosphatase family metal-dependent hydrolase
MAARRSRIALVTFVLASAVPWQALSPSSAAVLGGPLCGTAKAAGTPAATHTLRVATLNVLHGLEETSSYPTHSTLDERLEMQVQELAAEGVDIVGMQEVSLTERPRKHQGGLVPRRMARRLAQVTGETWYWCWHLSNPHLPVEPDVYPGGGGPISDVIASQASSNYGSFKEGSAVLSRYPIERSTARRLPLRLPIEYVACPPDEVPFCNLTAIFDHRIALWARMATPLGPVDLITTHFVHGITPFSDASAFVQAAALLAYSEDMTLRHGRPALKFITCDCNATTADQPPVIGLITSAGWTDTWASLNPSLRCAPPGDRSGCTSDQDILSPVSTTTSRIDYVFARSGSCRIRLLGSEKIADSPSAAATSTGFLWPSDHHGVATDVATAGC